MSALLVALALSACGPGESSIGGNNSSPDAGGLPPPTPTPCTKSWYYPDADGDGYGDSNHPVEQCSAPAGHVSNDLDCDDTDAQTYPGAPELADGKDNSCDGRIDFGAPGVDFDGDGYPGFDLAGNPVDCDDDLPLVNPGAIEVPGDGVDNNCNGVVDEVIDCEAGITATGTSSPTASSSYAQAIGLCGEFVQSVALTKGSTASRSIRKKLGSNFDPQAGAWMLHMSSGEAKDKVDDSGWSPQQGRDFGGNDAHPLWSPPPQGCGSNTPVASARDLSEITLTLKVPSNAKSFSFQVNFFSAEYPEWVCTSYNDRFVALLHSTALDPAKLPGGAAAENRNCKTVDGKRFCNVTFDASMPAQPLTVNNNFFKICDGTGCEKPSSFLAGTGYENNVGGATGWLTTTAPVTPGETITLRFAIFDEGDGILDSAVLIDNFKWAAEAVDAPTTVPIN